jgi:hypothetical protein
VTAVSINSNLFCLLLGGSRRELLEKVVGARETHLVVGGGG